MQLYGYNLLVGINKKNKLLLKSLKNMSDMSVLEVWGIDWFNITFNFI